MGIYPTCYGGTYPTKKPFISARKNRRWPTKVEAPTEIATWIDSSSTSSLFRYLNEIDRTDGCRAMAVSKKLQGTGPQYFEENKSPRLPDSPWTANKDTNQPHMCRSNVWRQESLERTFWYAKGASRRGEIMVNQCFSHDKVLRTDESTAECPRGKVRGKCPVAFQYIILVNK